MRDFDPSLLKAHFGQLVDAVGTQEAAATFLGISRQRVGQLIATATNDLPTWAQVWKLEQVCRQSLVFGAFGRMVEIDAASDTLAAAVRSTAASSAALSTIHAARADGVIEDCEAAAIKDRARENLDAAQRQYDAAMQVKPTLRAVA